MRRLVPILALAAVLTAAYWFDGILPGIRNTATSTFDPAPLLWTLTAAKLAAALTVAGLGSLLFLWSPPSRLTGLVFALVGGLLLLAWPIAVTFHVDLPGFDVLNLYVRLGEDGLLVLVAPFVTAFGLLRLIWPVPTFGPRFNPAQP
jgi:hypothetical protein